MPAPARSTRPRGSTPSWSRSIRSIRLIAPTTEHLAEAAYDANDAAWSAELSSRLAAAGSSAEYELKGKLELGWSQFKAGKLAEAAATFDEVLKKNPPAAIAAEAALVRGHILEQLGQNEPALAMYDLVIEQYPDSQQHADALLAAARLHDKLKQPEAVARSTSGWPRSIRSFPSSTPRSTSGRGRLQELGKPEDADRLFERLHKEFPQSRFWADATCRLAQRALDAKDYREPTAGRRGLIDEACRRIRGAGQPDPQVREYAMFLRGQIAVAKADWPKVREAFEALGQGVSRQPAAAGCGVLDRRGVLSPGRLCRRRPPGSSGLPSRSGKARALDGDDPAAAGPNAGQAEPMERRLRDRRQDRKGLPQFRAAVRSGLPAGAMSGQPGRFRGAPGRRTTR